MATLISIDEARRYVLAAVSPLPAERVALEVALGRVVSEGLHSRSDVPPFDSSAMDGFAVAPGAEGVLEISGEARAGSPSPTPVRPGSAVRISTGAVVPRGAGAVVALEQAEVSGERVRVPAPPAGDNIRRRGEALAAGALLLREGAGLGPAALGVLASAGHCEVRCARRPRVAIVTTGDELVPPGHPLEPGQIWSSNPIALAGQVALAGGVTQGSETVADDPQATRDALRGALAAADVVCVSGGVSVGPHDHVKGALAELGVSERFWGVALRPGKPTWFGELAGDARSVLVFGLPGNPVSAMVTFQLFVAPALRALQGADPSATRLTAILDENVPRNPVREQAIRCVLRTGDDGWHATPTGAQESHVLSSMLDAGALALIPAGEGMVAAGERVSAELLTGLWCA
ncbi:MAG: molybdopterin molybdotransferase MoeA [Thermoleophilaceae bacterium]|nr:molybdopterin molybdotransferase MoeA [Thermoleophilaceae bacterium]